MPSKPHSIIDSPTFLMKAATFAAVASALILIVIKTIGFLLTNSVAILSSLIDSTFDLISSVVNFWAVSHSLVPADAEHRFGHGKAEPLAALVQAAFVCGSAILLLVESASRVARPQEVMAGSLGIIIMLSATIITLGLVGFQKFVVKRTGSVAISADSLHYTGDLFLNFSVILALFLSTKVQLLWADTLIAIIIAIFLLWNAIKIARQAISVLMDEELSADQRQKIKDIALSHKCVHDVHELRTRSSGLNTFIQMHIVLDADLSLLEAHNIADDVELLLIKVYPRSDIIIHQDPAGIPEYHSPVGAAVP